MLFSNALLFAIAGATVSAAVDIKLPEGWTAVEKREEAPRLNKLFARLAKRKLNAQDSSKIPPGVTYTYIDATTTITVVGGSTKTTVTPSSTKTSVVPSSAITSAPAVSSSTTGGVFQTSTEVIATSCDDFGDCVTTTIVLQYMTQ